MSVNSTVHYTYNKGSVGVISPHSLSEYSYRDRSENLNFRLRESCLGVTSETELSDGPDNQQLDIAEPDPSIRMCLRRVLQEFLSQTTIRD